MKLLNSVSVRGGKIKFAFYLVVAIVVSVGLTISLQALLAAWSGPLSAPPTCNTGDPGCNPPIYNEGTANLPAILNPLGVSGNLTVTGDITASGNIKNSTTIKKDASGNVIIQLGN